MSVCVFVVKRQGRMIACHHVCGEGQRAAERKPPLLLFVIGVQHAEGQGRSQTPLPS